MTDRVVPIVADARTAWFAQVVEAVARDAEQTYVGLVGNGWSDAAAIDAVVNGVEAFTDDMHGSGGRGITGRPLGVLTTTPPHKVGVRAAGWVRPGRLNSEKHSGTARIFG
jgi:hypothetical protein